MQKYRIKVFITQLLLVVILLFMWEASVKSGLISSFIYSSPSRVINTLYKLLMNNNLVHHIMVTLTEIGISFTLGITIAFISSILLYENKFLSDVLDPFLTMLNSLPKVALGPIIIIWCGANKSSIIVMALLINVIISIITIYNGFKYTDTTRLKLFKSLKATKLETLLKLVIPYNVNAIFSALKINISLTLIGVIMGEFLVSKEGLGYLILYGTQVFNLDIVISGILVLILVSYFIYKVINYIERLVIKD